MFAKKAIKNLLTNTCLPTKLPYLIQTDVN